MYAIWVHDGYDVVTQLHAKAEEERMKDLQRVFAKFPALRRLCTRPRPETSGLGDGGGVRPVSGGFRRKDTPDRWHSKVLENVI